MYYDYPMPKLLQEELFSTMRENPWQRDIKVKTEEKKENQPHRTSAEPSLAKSAATRVLSKNPLSCKPSTIGFQSLVKDESKKGICPNREVLKNLNSNQIKSLDAKTPATTSERAKANKQNDHTYNSAKMYNEDSTFMVDKCRIHEGPYCILRNCKKDYHFTYKPYHSHMLVGIPICNMCHKRFATRDEYNAHIADCNANKKENEHAVKNSHNADDEDPSSEEKIDTNNIIRWLEKID
ncbi:hypothetical protein HN011_004567 [Eciton burchellii]|nr:hypothetical protein HN011_004567 [Eciton burchellii]